MPRLGKKLLISGNGRCNMLNDDLFARHYNIAARALVTSIFSRFGKNDIADFFKGLGLQMFSKDSRVFPITNNASSVLKILETELRRLSVPVELGFEAVDISDFRGGFIIKSRKGAELECDKVILTGGGMTYPSLGSDGSSYELAKQLGHKIITPVPSAVPLTVKDPLCHLLQGQKIFAAVKALINGKIKSEATGDVLFTKYGFSGKAILGINEKK